MDQFVLGLQMLFGVTAKAQALEVDDSSGQAAAAAEAVERPDKDHVELLPSGVGEQLSALRAVCAYAMGRFPRRTGF